MVVLGAGTGVGKTWASTSVLRFLRVSGITVAARKPVQSYRPCDDTTDAEVLAGASGEAPEEVCPRDRWYGVPMAPPIAAAFLGMAPPTLDELMAGVRWPKPRVAVGLVETVGGPRSPLAADADSAALAQALEPDLAVLVAHAGLGAINAVRLSAPVVPRPLVVFLSHFDNSDVQDRNLRWLQAESYDVVVDPAELARRVLGTRR